MLRRACTQVSLFLSSLALLVSPQERPQVLQLGHLSPERIDVDIVPVLIEKLSSARTRVRKEFGLTVAMSRRIGTMRLTKRARRP